MFFSFIKATALVLSSSTLTLAFSKISVPSVITAGVSAQIKLTRAAWDFQYDSYRVYLAMAPPNLVFTPICYLLNSSSTQTVDFSVTIPASVGPSGSQYYSIAVREFNQNPSIGPGVSSFQYSSNITFTGGKGSLSTYETSGHIVYDADSLPCIAYDCARNCSQKYNPPTVVQFVIGSDYSAYESTYDCIGQCPSVVQPPWDSAVFTAYGDNTSTKTKTKTASSTATGTAKGKTTATASRTSSGAYATSTGKQKSASAKNEASNLSALIAGIMALVALYSL
jgi:hypothetical protein